MKKEYCKPIVVFESFSMSTNIAGDCEYKTNIPSRNTCAYYSSGGIALFTATMVNVCDFTPSDGKGDGFCYHIPEGGPNIFNS